jgi:micrococcal nuclease
LAIDTPETVKPGTPVQPYGKEASEFTSNALKNAKEIRLEYEESNKIDKYNRTLAYVFVDGELLQEQLLLKGYAKMTCLCNNYRYSSILNAAERKAKENKLGLWGHK